MAAGLFVVGAAGGDSSGGTKAPYAYIVGSKRAVEFLCSTGWAH